MPTLDWEISTIATSEPQHIKCARQLAAAGCSINVIVGTPFGWAGHSDIIAARERNERISALETWQASQIAMACTYYSEDWIQQWSNLVENSGIEVATAQNFNDHGLA